jgi:hypothetical protein
VLLIGQTAILQVYAVEIEFKKNRKIIVDVVWPRSAAEEEVP